MDGKEAGWVEKRQMDRKEDGIKKISKSLERIETNRIEDGTIKQWGIR